MPLRGTFNHENLLLYNSSIVLSPRRRPIAHWSLEPVRQSGLDIATNLKLSLLARGAECSAFRWPSVTPQLTHFCATHAKLRRGRLSPIPPIYPVLFSQQEHGAAQ